MTTTATASFAAPAMPSAPATGSHFADASAARRAVDLALPMIEAAVRQPDVSGMGFLAIVVMDPALGPRDAGFEQAVLLEHAVGDRSAWDADYFAYARPKARIAWQHGRDSAVVQQLAPHALREGEGLLWGSVCLDGIVVAVSGAMPWFDEAFALAIAGNLRAIAKARHAQALEAGHVHAGPSLR